MKKIPSHFLIMCCAAASAIPHTAHAASGVPALSRALSPRTFNFVFDPQSVQITTLHQFLNFYGEFPQSDLAIGPDGAFYGVTHNGGFFGDGGDFGTIFKISQSGAFSTLFKFNGANGANPDQQKLTFTADGSFYGVTPSGGKYGSGTLFKVDSGGKLTTIHNFESSYLSPAGPPIVAPDGNLYGATADTIYRIVQGNYETVHQFDASRVEGVGGAGGLTVGADGALYGCTASGGRGYGVVYRVALAGDLTVLHAFHNSDGSSPLTGLTLASDGSLYGSTYSGGSGGLGTIFKIAPDGSFVKLHAFSRDGHGSHPVAPLTLGADGNFYGTTLSGGIHDQGTVFELNPDGELTTLYKFHAAPDGSYPHGAIPGGGVTFGSDGALYGVTAEGGQNRQGTVYRLTLPSP